MQPSSAAMTWAFSRMASTSAAVTESSGWRTSIQRSTREAITLVPPGTGWSRPTVARASRYFRGGIADADHDFGGGDHGVLTVRHQGGPGVVALAADAELPAAVAQD